MKNVFAGLAAFYILAGILFICAMDQNPGLWIMVVMCFIGAVGFSDASLEEWEEQDYNLSLYEGAGHD